jgi:MYXO-CTERM domain-containing protein
MRVPFVNAAMAWGVTVVASAPAFAFFPPVVAPINRPVTIVRDPVVEPIKDPEVCPSIDPCKKPTCKPRPKPEYCGCTPTEAQNAPEPATLVSAGVGLAIAGAAGWVRKRKATH